MMGVYSALTSLESQGYLVEADPISDLPQAAFWSSLGIDAVTAHCKLEQAKVSVDRVIALRLDRYSLYL
jgi:hypothetical protein